LPGGDTRTHARARAHTHTHTHTNVFCLNTHQYYTHTTQKGSTMMVIQKVVA